MSEYGSLAEQTIAPGASAVFTEAIVPCARGFVKWREGSGNFLLNGWTPWNYRNCCGNSKSAQYSVLFTANVAIPEGGTPGEISLAMSIDGSPEQSTIMLATPAAVQEYFMVARSKMVDVWKNCCENVSIVNLSDQPILMKAAIIDINRPDLAVTY